MNSISWLIYWAEVFSNIQICLTIFITIFGIIGFILILIIIAILSLKEQPKDKQFKNANFFGKIFLGVLFAICLLSTVRIFIPSQNTVLAIAASQATEFAVNSPQSREMLNIFQKSIQKKLEN